jgi:hypothetical protein
MGGFAVSSFSPAWLALREPADVAARNPAVLKACADFFAGRPALSICDLGAGAGASVRVFADLLPDRQQWTLVDHDAGNLTAAQNALAAWADETSLQGTGLVFRHGLKHITVHTHVYDFARNPACWPEGTELVTASALFDLASASWIGECVAALAITQLPLLASLTFDGKIESEPVHPLDASVIKQFCMHQIGDKGFGPAAGPEAALCLEQTLEKHRYTTTIGESPWILTRAESELLKSTAEGIAGAVAELGAMDAANLEAWLNHQLAQSQRLVIGHRDVFAR